MNNESQTDHPETNGRSQLSNNMTDQNNHKTCRVLVTGATGQLGRSLAACCPPDFDYVGLTRQDLDLGDLSTLQTKLQAKIEAVQPSFILNTAAYTAVDQAESEVEQAWCVNAVAPGLVAAVAAHYQIPILHYSTDYVFDGQKSDPYTEADPTNPLSVYGRSKLAGEYAVTAGNDLSLILRTSWVFSQHGHNFLKTMLRLGAERDTLAVVSDQVGAPTSAHWLAQATYTMLRILRDSQQPTQYAGLYHMTADGHTSWHGYAQYLLTQAREMGFELRVPIDQVLMQTSAQYPTPAARPLMGRLDTTRLQTTFEIEPEHWQTGVQDVLMRLQKCEF